MIGSGAGGSAPAHRCAAAGWKVAVVDEQPYGGTCALRGCDPKKVLVAVTGAAATQRRLQGKGLSGDARVDWPALMAFKRTFTEPVPSKREAGLHAAGIATFQGRARFLAADRLSVGDAVLRGRHFIIASGAIPRSLDIPGEEQLITSSDFLDLGTLPPRLALVGAGYIGFEFAHIAHHAGAAVTMFGRGQPLPQFEREVVHALVEHTRDIGIEIIGADVTAARSARDGLSLSFTADDRAQCREVDVAVHSAGRVPATAALDLAAAGVATDEHGAVLVNQYLQSISNSRVYAAGDAALPPGSLPLTPVGAMEGKIVAANLLDGNATVPDYRGTASVVFTTPPLARVGLSEEAARSEGVDVHVKRGETGSWQASRRTGETAGVFKTITDRASGRVLGAHIFGHKADEVINVFALAVRAGLTADDVRHTLFASPTSTGDAVHMV